MAPVDCLDQGRATLYLLSKGFVSETGRPFPPVNSTRNSKNLNKRRLRRKETVKIPHHSSRPLWPVNVSEHPYSRNKCSQHSYLVFFPTKTDPFQDMDTSIILPAKPANRKPSSLALDHMSPLPPWHLLRWLACSAKSPAHGIQTWRPT